MRQTGGGGARARAVFDSPGNIITSSPNPSPVVGPRSSENEIDDGEGKRRWIDRPKSLRRLIGLGEAHELSQRPSGPPLRDGVGRGRSRHHRLLAGGMGKVE